MNRRFEVAFVATLAASLSVAAAEATPTITTSAQTSLGAQSDFDGPQLGGALSSSVASTSAASLCGITGTCAPGQSGNANALAAQSETPLGIFSALQADATFFSGASNTIAARTTWEESPPIAGPNSITLFIKPGELTIVDFASIVFSHVTTARYRIELTLNGTVVFFSEAALSGGPGGLTLVESGTDLGGTPFMDADFPNNVRGYRFDSLFTHIDLGNLTTSDVVRYTMEVSVSGPGLETGGFARVGDPFDLCGAGSSIAFGTPVPEPHAALLLTLMGVVGLVIWRARTRRRARSR